MDIPVYLFTGFLESGKTKFIQETLCDKTFFEQGDERTLVILCEEGEVELEPDQFYSKAVYIETIDEQRRLNPDKFEALLRKHNANRVMIEYNGMWLVSDLFQALPENWVIYQEFLFADANTIEVYNANMRNLVVDKLNSCDLAVFNRCTDATDREALHKLVRGVSRRSDIVYEKTDGSVAYDDIEDPLPFDVQAPVIEIGDGDYALFYRDLCENTMQYDGKTVTFLGRVSKRTGLPKNGFIIGRPIMTCCVEDIQFSGMFCEDGAKEVMDDTWARITARMSVKNCKVYGRKGPVLHMISVESAQAPEQPVATFF